MTEDSTASTEIKLSADAIWSFVQLFLLSRYDSPKATPPFHNKMWELCCSENRLVAMAAPRGSAKSTAITLAYTLANVLFRIKDYVLIVSDTEGQATQFLNNIKVELMENELIRTEFGIEKFNKDTETDVIVRTKDGHQFRLMAKGSEQKVRGLNWRNKRPNLVIGDDLENDEICMNPERREKFRNWFNNALLPCGSDTCTYRIVGTILHLDSMLNRLLNNRAWSSLRFAAHNKDFTDLLWPEKYDEARLREIRLGYEEDGNIEGYAQEYLNNPIPEGATFFREQDFIPMDTEDYSSHKKYFAAADFAISEKEKADYTVIVVAGMDENGVIHIVDTRRGRWDADEIINELISVQKRYDPEIFTFETEKIDKAIGPSLNRAMIREGTFLNIRKITPTKSKTTRGRSIQKTMRAGGVRFNEHADWYIDMKTELMTMTPSGPRGKHDDYFDAFAYIGLTVDKYYEAETVHEMEQEEYYDEYQESGLSYQGMCESTGY